jgi:hypothetical protein
LFTAVSHAESFLVEETAIASGGSISVQTEMEERTAKGSSLWKPRRELLTPTPSVRSQGASARR